jgi:uncharacterized integral membrane protein (TIGR00697 family)
LLFLFYHWGYAGVVAFIVVAGVVANIQVLKLATLSETTEIALGTLIFSSLFWSFDILTEFWGKKKAMQALWISFFITLLVAVWIALTRTYPFQATERGLLVQQALNTLFNPAFSIFAASILAYVTSQLLDISLFSAIKKATQGRLLWLRTTVSTLVSGFLDHCLFTYLAFVVFGTFFVEPSVLLWSYIIGGYVMRLIFCLLSPTILYLARYLKAVPSQEKI